MLRRIAVTGLLILSTVSVSLSTVPSAVAAPVRPTQGSSTITRIPASIELAAPRVAPKSVAPRVVINPAAIRAHTSTSHASTWPGWRVFPRWIHHFSTCVQNHESARAHRYRALNPSQNASGAYQMLDGTWRRLLRVLHLTPTYRKAMFAPPDLQDLVFARAVQRGGVHNWNGTRCGMGT